MWFTEGAAFAGRAQRLAMIGGGAAWGEWVFSWLSNEGFLVWFTEAAVFAGRAQCLAINGGGRPGVSGLSRDLWMMRSWIGVRRRPGGHLFEASRAVAVGRASASRREVWLPSYGARVPERGGLGAQVVPDSVRFSLSLLGSELDAARAPRNSSDSVLTRWDSRALANVRSADELLVRLDGPAIIRFGAGGGVSRCAVTLLHANEPSGVHAVARLLSEAFEPVVPLDVIIAQVQAARVEPRFSHRMLPGHRDLNRCFAPPFEGADGALAEVILETVRQLAPACMVDLHNTSGTGPGYAVLLQTDDQRRALAGHWVDLAIHAELRMGTLGEIVDEDCPVSIIECGGARDPEAHELAYQGLRRFALAEDPLAPQGELPRLVEHPTRVVLAPGARLAYGSVPQPGVDITLVESIEVFNREPAGAHSCLGWVGSEGISALRGETGDRIQSVAHLFVVRDGALYPRQPVQLLMATTNHRIATTDCLFYVVPFADFAP